MLAYPRQFCSVCNQPLTVHRVVHGFCDTPACLAAVGRRRVTERQAEQRAAIAAVAEKFSQSLLLQHPLLQTRGVESVVVPGFESASQPMTSERREMLRAHLEVVLAEIGEEAHRDPVAEYTSDTRRKLDAACATCRGYCCRKGGDSAYIRAETIARVRRLHPDLSEAAITATYLSAVPAVSMVGSCIFHGERGCALPRDFRADICNDYFCPPLESWLSRDQRAPLIVMTVDKERIDRSDLIE